MYTHTHTELRLAVDFALALILPTRAATLVKVAGSFCPVHRPCIVVFFTHGASTLWRSCYCTHTKKVAGGTSPTPHPPHPPRTPHPNFPPFCRPPCIDPLFPAARLPCHNISMETVSAIILAACSPLTWSRVELSRGRPPSPPPDEPAFITACSCIACRLVPPPVWNSPQSVGGYGTQRAVYVPAGGSLGICADTRLGGEAPWELWQLCVCLCVCVWGGGGACVCVCVVVCVCFVRKTTGIFHAIGKVLKVDTKMYKIH